jgi:hypothetical protein
MGDLVLQNVDLGGHRSLVIEVGQPLASATMSSCGMQIRPRAVIPSAASYPPLVASMANSSGSSTSMSTVYSFGLPVSTARRCPVQRAEAFKRRRGEDSFVESIPKYGPLSLGGGSLLDGSLLQLTPSQLFGWRATTAGWICSHMEMA